MKIAVVGATGLVGSVMLKVLNERGFANNEIIAAASVKSVGKKIKFADRFLTVVSVQEAINSNCDYAIFSAGSSVSKQYAPLFAEKGTTVIDNSSCWRMNKECPLVVPEINIDAIKKENKIIANPNCSTIQMVLALYPLHKAFHIKRIVVSTYQSVTGTGVKAVRQLEAEERGEECEKAYNYQIHRNVFPHGGDFLDNGYTTEEEKLVNETKKILFSPEILVSATVARVPVVGGHSEAVNIEFEKPFTIEEVFNLLNNQEGIKVLDDIKNNIYPMPIISEGKDDVFVGRIRRDDTINNGLNLWVVSDNLRKGAATNAIQIMERLIKRRG
jgi:aspartate-semialdehyde dehydrogenase